MEIKASLLMPSKEKSLEMKANLATKEPLILNKWNEMNLYDMVIKNNSGKPYYMLHDGPPYANGDIHLGHALNKILKDFIIRYKNMSGFCTPYIPGWDTHGLPIESVLAKKGVKRKEMDLPTYRNMCKEYALSQVERQKEGFKRLGSIGDYDHPYLTLLKEFEAHQIDVFAKMALDGLAFKGKKPVYWSPSSESCLAEAEIEYYDVTSTSIYVRFKVLDGKGKFNDDEYFVIWTTTPWTMPANLAICLNPDFEYGVYETNKGKLIFLVELADQIAKILDLGEIKLLRTFIGKEAEYVTTKHPLYNRESVIILGDHVTNDSGTGCVHTAPGHGEDDFIVGQKYGLDCLCPVDEKGFMMKACGEELEGMFYEEANDKVLEMLEREQALLKATPITHSYPHDWRTKKPIIFRTTAQWFVSIDPIRQKILDQIKNVKWYPSWGDVRLSNMIKDRKSWCVSRQRAWGVPLPIIYCEDETPIIDRKVFDHYIELVKQYGSNVWFEKTEKELLPEGYTNIHSPNNKFRKETDIMDVWFDSGSSSIGALEGRGYPYPADLYLEGSDQYRGWFNSSIICGTAYKGVSPYKTCVSHGFTLDGKGNKMSKSLGNTVDPNKVCNQYGADVLRLWVASTDYQSDMRLSDDILKQVSENYRKIRNTLRFLQANLNDGNFGKFDYKKDMVNKLDVIDEYMIEKLHKLVNNCLEAYDEFAFNQVSNEILNFMTVDLSNFYLYITKDVLYCDHYNSVRRRQIQTTYYIILDTLVRLLNPIIPFTMDEVASFLDYDVKNVTLLDMPKSCKIDEDKLNEFELLNKVRVSVLKALEEKRADGIIGNSQEACIDIEISDEKTNQLFNKLSKEEIQRFFVVSKVNFVKDLDAFDYNGTKVKVYKDEKLVRCERCWNNVDKVDDRCLCERCSKVLKEYESHE